MLMIVMLFVTSMPREEEDNRPPAACPFCWPEYIIESPVSDTNGYDDVPIEWDDCNTAHHVHDYSWESTSYACPRCHGTWVEFEHAPECPVCGWHRTDPVMKYDPCKESS